MTPTTYEDLEDSAENYFGRPSKNRRVKDATGLIGLAIDPTSERNGVLLGSGNFFVTTDEGRRWTQDFIPFASIYGIRDPYTSTEVAIQPAGIAFDRTGHTAVAGTSSGFVTTGDGYGEFYSEIVALEGLSHGQFLSNVPIVVATPDCDEDYPYCNDTLAAQGVVTDTSGTSTDGTTYVYYTIYCNSPYIGCLGGGLPSGSSTLWEASSVAAGKPYLRGGPVSSLFSLNVGGAGAIVDSTGTPHFIYSDYTNAPVINLQLDALDSTLTSVVDAGLKNPNWEFPPTYETVTPRCSGYQTTAYCAFDATQIRTGPAQATVSVYLAVIDVQSGTATITRVNNDPLGNGKEHFNPSVAVTPDGDVYVSWFDDRRDAANKKVDYFLGRSVDGGKTFPKQEPVNDVSFSPVIGTGESSQTLPLNGSIAAGPNGIIHATWTDTRSGTGAQVYTRDIRW